MRKFVLPAFVLITILVNSFWLSPQAPAQVKDQKKNQSTPTVEKFLSPIRIAFGPKRKLLVSDYRLGMVLIINPRKNRITGKFKVGDKPLGVAGTKNYIYVGSESKACIEVYDKKGRWLKDIGHHIKKPTDIAVDSRSNRIFVVDTLAKVVKVYKFSGKALPSIPQSPDNNMLSNPTGIALDTVRHEVFVSDYGDEIVDPRIQIFDYYGNHVGYISGKSGGGWFKPSYFFNRPQGLSVDKSGRVFLVDCFAGEILVFNRSTGKLLKTIGSHASNPGGQFRLPLDIVIDDKTKDIFVTNNRLKRIEVFRKGGIVQ